MNETKRFEPKPERETNDSSIEDHAEAMKPSTHKATIALKLFRYKQTANYTMPSDGIFFYNVAMES